MALVATLADSIQSIERQPLSVISAMVMDFSFQGFQITVDELSFSAPFSITLLETTIFLFNPGSRRYIDCGESR